MYHINGEWRGVGWHKKRLFLTTRSSPNAKFQLAWLDLTLQIECSFQRWAQQHPLSPPLHRGLPPPSQCWPSLLSPSCLADCEEHCSWPVMKAPRKPIITAVGRSKPYKHCCSTSLGQHRARSCSWFLASCVATQHYLIRISRGSWTFARVGHLWKINPPLSTVLASFGSSWTENVNKKRTGKRGEITMNLSDRRSQPPPGA